ncbi:hypothetical protein ND861_04835 [Leptospira sp. 2 VSF19]|uniref:Uncharacterized protein n=1 Tax=Leptospira soteropolitanensis TaxID=2950025 RepID=A0AAW5VMU9_9LEPT|nr:hypothetical protein [Leptospira soteropolitanensis]MCW7491976.1 hypothetical protein [Leptospira soteropolitanensis]MCW7499559.1 hypothetical protein [Leptospira soteropolitanensis]MCW7521810.1 hypothetical protein [Leptospira soteropolitanensis]MCW7525663.1 hypothetical protein [Leptospira soteropolitanensis]MCW7530222.1 hypothetical protein [Leptospira soteropolitanensis]
MNSSNNPDSNTKTEDDLITVEYQGVELTAKFILRTKRDFAIEILSPYSGFLTGLHKPCFADPKSSFLNAEGIFKAEGMLIKLYIILKQFFENIESIKSEIPIIQEEHEVTNSKILELKNDLKNLKSKMKKKILTPLEYQRSIKPLKKEIKNLKCSKFDSFERLLEKNLQTIVPYNLRFEFYEFLIKETKAI